MAQNGYRTASKGLVTAVSLALLAGIALLLAKIFWILVTPVGPFGRQVQGLQPASLASLTAIDPFFRQAKPDAGSVVTGLPLKLFGTRLDDVTGLNSAIIATPDGLQSSYVVGETILPGVKLASVARDGVTIDRGGALERLFLDQSVPAPTPAPAVASQWAPITNPLAQSVPTPPPPQISPPQTPGVAP